MRNALHGEVLPLLWPREAVTVGSTVGGGRQTAWLAAHTTKPAREATRAGFFAVEALFAIAQAEEMFLSVVCVYRWAQGLRPGGFGSSEGPPNHVSLRQEMNKGRLLRACVELCNEPAGFNPAGLFARVAPCLSHTGVSHP